MAAEHGTRARYTAGCHCDPCTVANRDYMRAYMAARYVSHPTPGLSGYRRADGTVRPQGIWHSGRVGRPPKIG